MVDWTDELKADVIERYKKAQPEPETSIEIVKEIADSLEGCTSNGVRAILSKAGVYVKKAASTGDGDKPKTKRVSKADSISELKETITGSGCDIDDEILDKLTGKAAIYFTGVVTRLALRGE